MKLQGLSIVFALVVLPLILVLSYYVQLQVDTIEMQSSYDFKLLNATYDAMSSFELNTANEDLSTVSDSLRTIVEASYNVFINTLSTNLGMSNASKSYVEPYIPAVLYTLYDGYYIYAPTQVPTMLTDDDGVALYVGGKYVKGIGPYQYDKNLYKENEDGTVIRDERILASSLYNGSDDDPSSTIQDYGQYLYVSKDTPNNVTAKNQMIYTTKISDAKLTTKNVLKTYMPYSARYINNSDASKPIDVTVIYTLDNYISVEGSIGTKYYTESGYLLKSSSVEILSSDDILKFNQSDAEENIKNGGSGVRLKIDDAVINVPVRENPTSGTDSLTGLPWENDASFDGLNNEITICNNALIDAQNELYNLSANVATTDHEIENCRAKIKIYQDRVTRDTYKLQQMNAVIYYVKAKIFSTWIENNLMKLEEADLVEISGQKYTTISENIEGTGYEELIHDFKNSHNKIFSTKSDTVNKSTALTEVDEDSTFYSHKLNVIRNSIQYNLNLAMSSYNNNTSFLFDYSMPVMKSTEWDRILNNPSIVSFMQGYSCGLKTYSNYKIATSVNNEISISTDDIYYVNTSKFCDENSDYHKINCPRLINEDTGKIVEVTNGDENKDDYQITNPDLAGLTDNYIAFTSKDAKYDKENGKSDKSSTYYYDHKNLACTKCIIDGNYINNTNLFDSSISEYANLRRAYYEGVGAIRNNLYKMNSFAISEGYEVFLDIGKAVHPSSNVQLKDVKSIDLVFDTIKATDAHENTVRFKVRSGSKYLSDNIYSVVVNSTNKISVHIDVKHDLGNDIINANSLYFDCNVLDSGGHPNSTIYSYKGSTPAINNDINNYDYEKRFNKIFTDSMIFYKINYK